MEKKKKLSGGREKAHWGKASSKFVYFYSESYCSVSSNKITSGSKCRAVLCLVVQSYLTLCDPMDCSLPGSSVHGIVQARILEWVSMPSSRGSSQPRDRIQISLWRRILYHLSHQGSSGSKGSIQEMLGNQCKLFEGKGCDFLSKCCFPKNIEQCLIHSRRSNHLLTECSTTAFTPKGVLKRR